MKSTYAVPAARPPAYPRAAVRAAAGVAEVGDGTTSRALSRLMVARLLLVPALPACFFVGSVLTYRTWAHGELDAYLRWLLFVGGLGLAAYGVVRARALFHSLWPLASLVLVLLAAVSVHAGRLVHPAGHDLAYLATADDFHKGRLDPARWESALAPGARMAVEPGVARLIAPAEATAFLELRLPTSVAWWLRPPASWWLPVTFDERRFAEEVEWQARVERTGTYFVLAETEHLLIQLTPYGLHLTYRDRAGHTAATEVPLPRAQEPRDHGWRLRGTGTQLALEMDGQLLWSMPVAEPFGRIRFGETRSDMLHGGTIELRSARFRRWWDSTSPIRSGVT